MTLKRFDLKGQKIFCRIFPFLFLIPLWGDNIGLYSSQDFDYTGFHPFNILELRYSQDNEFMKLRGRRSAEIFLILNTDSKRESAYHSIGFGLSQEFHLRLIKYVFLGFSLGIYIRSNIDDRIGSNFNFGERLFFLFPTKHIDYELYLRHFSNGALALPNGGYTTAGIGVSYKFIPR